MKETPHSHDINIRVHGYFWGITYGDQTDLPNYPPRRLWDSDLSFAKRKAKALEGHIARLVQKHDDQSRIAGATQARIPQFRPDEWGSDQLKTADLGLAKP